MAEESNKDRIEPNAANLSDVPNASSNEQESIASDPLEEVDTTRSKAEMMAESRHRIRLLQRLGIDDEEAATLYARMRFAALDGSAALRGSSALERIEKLGDELDTKIRRLPRFAFPEFRSRYRVNQRMKITSEPSRHISEDADELAQMLVLSSEMIVLMRNEIEQQISMHEELSARFDSTRRIEDQMVSALPAWTVDAARMIEAMGFDRLSFRSKGRQIVSDIQAVLERHSDSEPNAPDTASRMAERLAQSIDASTDNHLFPSDASNADEHHASDGSPVLSHSASAMANGEPNMSDDTAGKTSESNGKRALGGPDREPDEKPQAWSVTPMIGPFFGPDNGAKGPSDQDEDKPRANGFAMIEGVDFVAGYDACFSQFDRGSASPVDANIMARMEERAALDMEQIVLVDGALPDIAWTKYEVPAGDYILLQMRGHSEVLPWLREDTRALGKVSGMMPPYVSMVRYGKMIGLADKELRALSMWDRPSFGPDYLSASRLDGGRSDPALAFEVIHRAVAMHLPGVLAADRQAYIDDRTIENMARFWLFLVIGRTRPEQLELLWPGGFFHGVEGHDVGLGNEGYMRLVRRMAGSIEHAIDPAVADNIVV